MPNSSDPLERARASRDMARRARRLAETLTDTSDRSRLLRYADELEEQANGQQRQAAIAAAPGLQQATQQQQQQQQQGAAPEPADDPSEPKARE